MKITTIYILTFLLTSCVTTPNSGIIKVSDFNEKLSAANTVIIDVRTPEEYQKGIIEGAINIDYNGSNFNQEIEQLDKEKTYLIYCHSGKRSGNAYEKMKSSGFNKVYGLEGGIVAWEAEKMNVTIPTSQIIQPESKDPTDFKTAIMGEKLVFVDFNATWCGPCKKMQPFVDMLKEERSNEVIVFSIDTDQQTALAQEYQIQNLPTIMFIKNGSVLHRAEGYHDQKSLNDLVTKFK